MELSEQQVEQIVSKRSGEERTVEHGREYEKTVFSGQAEYEEPEGYVMMVYADGALYEGF